MFPQGKVCISHHDHLSEKKLSILKWRYCENLLLVHCVCSGRFLPYPRVVGLDSTQDPFHSTKVLTSDTDFYVTKSKAPISFPPQNFSWIQLNYPILGGLISVGIAVWKSCFFSFSLALFHCTIHWSLISMWGGRWGRARAGNPIQGQYWQRNLHLDATNTDQAQTLILPQNGSVWIFFFCCNTSFPISPPSPLVNHPRYLGRVW